MFTADPKWTLNAFASSLSSPEFLPSAEAPRIKPEICRANLGATDNAIFVGESGLTPHAGVDLIDDDASEG